MNAWWKWTGARGKAARWPICDGPTVRRWKGTRLVALISVHPAAKARARYSSVFAVGCAMSPGMIAPSSPLPIKVLCGWL